MINCSDYKKKRVSVNKKGTYWAGYCLWEDEIKGENILNEKVKKQSKLGGDGDKWRTEVPWIT